METYSYSAKNNAFYANSLRSNYAEWPEDATEVVAKVFTEFNQSPPEGKIRIAGNNGMPVWGDLPPLSHEESIDQAEAKVSALMSMAEEKIRPLQYAQGLDIATDEEVSKLKAWQIFSVKLNRVDVSAAPDIDWPVMPE